MKLFILIISITIMSNSFGQSEEYKNMLGKYYNDFPTISIKDALAHQKSKDALFLDIRKKSEFMVSHIESAKRMDPDGSTLSQLKNIDKDQLIIVYCSIGARSQTLGEKLKKEGYTNVKNMCGGLFYWANENYPMVDLKENKTERIHGYNSEWSKWVNGKVVL